jgi:hypothetical protein
MGPIEEVNIGLAELKCKMLMYLGENLNFGHKGNKLLDLDHEFQLFRLSLFPLYNNNTCAYFSLNYSHGHSIGDILTFSHLPCIMS